MVRMGVDWLCSMRRKTPIGKLVRIHMHSVMRRDLNISPDSDGPVETSFLCPSVPISDGGRNPIQKGGLTDRPEMQRPYLQ